MSSWSKITSVAYLKRTLKASVSALCIAVFFLTPALSQAADSTEDTSPKASNSSVERQIKMAQRLIYNEKYEEAVRNLRLTVKRYRRNADAWNLLGFSLRKSGEIDAASEAYNRALSLNRRHLGALEYQGKLFIYQGRLVDAKYNLERLNKLCPVGCVEQEDLAAAIEAAEAG